MTDGGWKFEEGILTTNSVSHTPVIRRIYYMRYAKGDLRRLFTVTMVYGINNTRDEILDWAVSKVEGSLSLDKFCKFIKSFSRISTIMDFNITETDQQPKPPTEIEKNFQYVTSDIEDENNPLSLKHFEKYLPQCSYEKCVCTLTNDEESLRRISEIYPGGIPEQSPSSS
jgi:hypothetical protein